MLSIVLNSLSETQLGRLLLGLRLLGTINTSSQLNLRYVIGMQIANVEIGQNFMRRLWMESIKWICRILTIGV